MAEMGSQGFQTDLERVGYQPGLLADLAALLALGT